MNKDKFHPLLFLASLGAGGISIIPFAFLQYAEYTGKGLITYAQLAHGTHPWQTELLFRSLEAVMVVFTFLHVWLTVRLLRGLIKWVKSPAYQEFIKDPLSNMGVLAPFISLTMTMNVMIGPVRFFSSWMSANLQAMMLPALVVWVLIWMLVLRMEISLLKISFTERFDVEKISFGWLLHPFTLGMVTVTGTGIAAMSKSPDIAHIAAFMSLISGTMGLFLLLVNLNAVFKNHFAASGLPDKQLMPSFLIVVPNITLYAISAFRFGHYLEHQFELHLPGYLIGVIALSFTFETWYMVFGLSVMKDYFRFDFFRKEFYVSQWGLVCPFVAYAVLASFFYKVFVASPIVYAGALAVTTGTIILFFLLLSRQKTCAALSSKDKTHDCSKGLVS